MKAYGAWGEKTLYGRKFMGTLRTTYVIGPEAKIKAVFPKVNPAGHEKEVLAVLQDNPENPIRPSAGL